MLAAGILSGAAFGDNLAPVSDTTIVSAYTQGALCAALAVLDELKKDNELLLKLAPKQLAGCASGTEPGETLNYLRELLQGLEYEAAARLVQVERE